MNKFFIAVLATLVSLSAYAGTCERPGQPTCWDLLVLNVKHDGKMMAGMNVAPADAEERQRRVNEAGPRLMRAYQEGSVSAGKPRTFLLYVWNGGKPQASYRVNGRKTEGGRVTNGRYEVVTGKVATPKMDKTEKLGTPKVYRLYAEGKDPIGISLQFHWSGLTEKSTILVRAEDDLTVYPHDDKDVSEGLWIMGPQIATLKQNTARGSIAPFISKE